MSANQEYICLQCSRVNTTCCTLRPGHERSFFPLSENEIKAIKSYLRRDDFFVRETAGRQLLDNLGKLMPGPKKPVSQCFPLDKLYSRLKTMSDGRCLLLTTDGCTLPVEVRPVYCRLYPFWFHNHKLTYLQDTYCLAQNRIKDVRGLVKLFGADPRQLKRDFHLLLDNLGLGDIA